MNASPIIFFRSLIVSPLLWIILCLPTHCIAQHHHGKVAVKRPTLVITPQVTVNSDMLTLGDVGKIVEGSSTNKKLARKLSSISLGESPAPGTSETIIGVNVIESIKAAGIAPNDIGYSIPKAITVHRTGRLLSPKEVLKAVREQLKTQKQHDLRVQEVKLTNKYMIPTGPTSIDVKQMGKAVGSTLPIRVEVNVDEQPAARFLATARIDYWSDIPVLTRTLERGMLISEKDIQMVRLNRSKLPDDIVENQNQAIGRRVKSRLKAGEPFRKNFIDIPPVIARGNRITMIYNADGITATATGVAMEDGQKGEVLRVRNDRSKKIVSAIILDSQKAMVKSQ